VKGSELIRELKRAPKVGSEVSVSVAEEENCKGRVNVDRDLRIQFQFHDVALLRSWLLNEDDNGRDEE